MSVELGVLAAHVPSICHRENIPPFQENLVKEMDQIAKDIEEINPELICIVSCHWISTFNHYVDVAPEHKGILTAFECPDIISDVAYEYKGDREIANEMVRAGKSARIPVTAVDDPTYVWDYGTVVPLRYLLPKLDVPVISLFIAEAAGLDETRQWGEVIRSVIDESGKKTVFIFSGALAHNLVRGRINMPTISEQALDKQFIDYTMQRDLQSMQTMLPQYANTAGVEGGGRHLAMMLGIIDEEYKPDFKAYAQSSGSGNAIITFEKEKSATKV
ncbi:extradiol ring-cleavage dioxygenase [Geomicrobium sp. JSM 1781026]|uniref:DODA-type extradiol aromatic ring-opening family dioxygenase n=1 Tax=Geomicrobium sp. JSM 1781026 TaxID=3344580 RepID=UPI0035C120DE